MLRRVGEIEDHVVVCGGGTPFYHDNFDWMKKQGKVIYLRAGIDRLVSNIRSDDKERPLLDKKNLSASIESLLTERAGLYESADIIVEAEKAALDTFASIFEQ